MRLGKKYNQDTIAYADAGERPRMFRLYPHRRMVSKHAYKADYGQKDLTGAYSEYHKRKFADQYNDPDFWAKE